MKRVPDSLFKKRHNGFFYGWIIVIAAFWTVLIGYGMRYTFPIFYIHILQEFGWARADTSLAFSILLLVYGLSASLIGYLVDRIGPRRVVFLGAVIIALGLMGLSQTSEIWHMYLFLGLFIALGTCATGNVSFIPIISNWFVRKRGKAMGIYFAGVSGAPAIAPLVVYIISWVGWRNAYLVLAGAVAAIIIPLATFVIGIRLQDKGLFPDGDLGVDRASLQSGSVTDVLIVNHEWVNTEWTVPKAVKTHQFWALFFLNFCVGIQINMLYLYQVVYMVDLGFSQVFSASILGIVGFATLTGSLCGHVSDRIGRERAYTITMPAVAVAIYVFIFANQPWMFYTYAMLFGFGLGISLPASICSQPDIFMSKKFGSINGLFLTGFGIGGFMGPLLGAWTFDVFQDYTIAFYLAFALTFVCIAMIWLAAPRKIRLVAGMARK